MNEHDLKNKAVPGKPPTSPITEEDLSKAYASLLDPELYKPDPLIAAALLKHEPYLLNLANDTGEIHSNSDHRIEDLTAYDMELSTEYV